MHGGIHSEHWLNDAHPAEDRRGSEPELAGFTEWCDDCKAHPVARYIFAGSGG